MNTKLFFTCIKGSLFNGKLSQSQVDNINSILKAMEEVGDGDKDTLAYSLATVYHEVGMAMAPVREGFAKTDAGARKAVAKLAAKRGPNSPPAKYGKSVEPYGHAYYGRGYPQLTWDYNYKDSSKDAGVDLLKNPDAMLDPRISARVLIRGIISGKWNGKGKGISFYEGSDDFLDPVEAEEARRTVNVKDKAKLIAGYHRKFYEALTKAKWGATPVKVTTPKEVVGTSTVAVGTAAGAALFAENSAYLWGISGAVVAILIGIVLYRLYKNKKGA